VTDQGHQWITLHRLRFARDFSALDSPFHTPKGIDCWRFCPSQRIGNDGLPTWTSTTWCGLAIHNNKADAEATMDAPVESLGFAQEIDEQWHALAVPISHRGELNWRGTVEKDSAIQVAPDDVGGPLAVVTTAGYNSRELVELSRLTNFMAGIDAVLKFFADHPGNLRRDVFSGGHDGIDGFTLSLWSDDPVMMQAAYREGNHRQMLDEHRDRPMFDRSSFTRMRLVRTAGSWGGDPVAESANV